MKITKRQIRRIIREALSTEVPELTGGRKSSFQVKKEKELAAKAASRAKAQDPIAMLEELNMNLQDIMANSRGPMYDDLNQQIALLENAIRALKQGTMQ